MTCQVVFFPSSVPWILPACNETLLVHSLRKTTEKKLSKVLRHASGGSSPAASESKQNDPAVEAPGGHEQGEPREGSGDIGNAKGAQLKGEHSWGPLLDDNSDCASSLL